MYYQCHSRHPRVLLHHLMTTTRRSALRNGTDDTVFALYRHATLTRRALAVGQQHCMESYEINVVQGEIDMCPPQPEPLLWRPTRVMTYNGTVPGPLFKIDSGTEVLVRFNNRLKEGKP